MIEAIKESIWLRGFLYKLSFKQGLVVVHYNSQSAIHLTKIQIYHERTKYIDVRYHFIREIISQCQIVVMKIGMTDNPADMMTKSFMVFKFK